MYIDKDCTKFGFHFHVCRNNRITPVLSIWWLHGMDAGIAIGRKTLFEIKLG